MSFYTGRYVQSHGASWNGVPLKIGELINGNVLSDPHQAYALAFGMVIIISVAMSIYFVLDRRASRWRRSVQ